MTSSTSQSAVSTAAPDYRAVEALVRQVLARLAGEQAAGQSEKSASAGPTTPVHVVAGRVVTLRDIEQRPFGVLDIVVSDKAIITPAAHDYVRDKKLRLIRGLSHGAAATAEASASVDRSDKRKLGQLFVATLTTGPATDGVVAQLERRKLPLLHEHFETLPLAMQRISERLSCSQRLACLLGSQGALACCLANRQGHMRAVTGGTGEDLQLAAGAVGANLLVLDPQRLGTFPALRAIELFAARGPVKPPAELMG